MPSGSRLLILTVAGFLGSLGAGFVAAQNASTVWDGAYTEEQASRAVATFGASCAECHTLSNAGDGQLVGTNFWEGYSQKTVADLLTFVKTNIVSNGRINRRHR